MSTIAEISDTARKKFVEILSTVSISGISNLRVVGCSASRLTDCPLDSVATLNADLIKNIQNNVLAIMFMTYLFL